MRKIGDFLLNTAAAVFGVAGIIVGSYIIYWLLTSPVIKAMVFK